MRVLPRTGLVLGLLLAGITVGAHVANRALPIGDALPNLFQPFWLINASSAVLFTIPGWYLATKRPEVAYGWLALAAGIGHGLAGVGLELAVAVELGHHHLPGAAAGMWLAVWAPLVEQPILTLFYGIFPDGQLPRGWKGRVVAVSVVWATFGTVMAFLDPTPGRGATVPAMLHLHNPLSVPFGTSSSNVAPIFFGPSAIAVIVVLVARWRQARGDDRRVLSWIVAIGVPTTLLVPIAVVALPANIGVAFAQATTVVEISVFVAATLRHHVYGVDFVLNRTLVYAALTAVVAAVYGVAVGAGSLVGANGSAPAFVAALIAALLLAPARSRIQRGVNRLLYGQRDEPSAVVSRVAAQLGAAGSAAELLPGLVAATASALRVPYVAIELTGGGGARVIAHGVRSDDVTRIPLVHQGGAIGALVVARRAGEREISQRERSLLTDLAGQAAVAAANVMLTEDLRQSRERIVTTREEERRRLRNDLHDGLGPQLTGVALGLDLVAEDAQANSPEAAAAADRLRAEVEDAIQDVRRLVQALRPPRLDEVGLCGALRDIATRAERSGLLVDADLAEGFAPLPAAVEVAAYRIASEAITNVVRHAGAASCSLTLRVGDELRLTIDDAGRGFRSADGGVGTTSMRERAEELGGTCTVSSNGAGGCRVDARLPVPR